ncbi:cysteine proteinase [Mytilinidion resinicola]|uniref:Ubiquitin carboxyl-terminal hydrolase n=1 Tax=Mytilinidion resinicola TaxID=574789 RepID=A0A6A6YI70_9PEZI|nr:cysteine proteinase [Mytilinidion resinicola]KAF2808536.1 cysteine proteinase [Mytilinidion resinicola]
MTSFFNRFVPKQPASPASASTPTKKDPNAPQPTPLEKLLADAGPIRDDGSDKFFGFENFGSTCYCNSIIQCLYYSVPFREQVINFPTRSPQEILERPSSQLRLYTDISPSANGHNGALSPTKTRNSLSSPNQPSPRKPVAMPGKDTNPPGTKPEDNKDSPEYKKKLALAAGPVLNMDYENSHSYGMSESLFTSLKDIFEAIISHRSRIGVVSPHKFLEILRRQHEMFRSAMHQDAHEFLNLLLNEVVENVEQFSNQLNNKSTDQNGGASEAGFVNALTSAVSAVVPTSGGSNSPTLNTGWVHELFEGTLTSETRCLTCENTSQRDEAFLDLSVDLEQHSSVTSCLRKFSEEEMLCERNKFHCDKCGGLQEAEKRMKIKRLPRVLALHLKRFKYTEDLQRLQKLFHRVVYPYYLRLFNTTDDAEDPDRLYELYAIIVHIGGGPYHGHYVSVIKTQDRGWLLFDDEMVEPVDKDYVRNFFGGENVLACAYVLFYQETTLEAMQKEQEAEGLAAATRASESEKNGVPVSGKQNGHAQPLNDHHPIHHATTPATEEPEFVNLDHAATAPPLLHHDPNPIEHAVTSTGILAPPLSSKKSNLQSKKEKAKEEKERKAAEKELERQAKLKQKEMELKRRETYRKQEEDLRAALALSKQTAAEEAQRTAATAEKSGVGKDKENTKGGGLSRFRHSSMSIRHKPKFWSGKEKTEHELTQPLNIQETPASTVEAENNDTTTPATGTPDKPEKMKNRFSLGRKKSGFLH